MQKIFPRPCRNGQKNVEIPKQNENIRLNYKYLEL